MTLAAEDIEAVAQAVVAKMPDPWLAQSPTCSTAEAMAFTRIRSDSSWWRFCKATGLEALGGGRWSRVAVQRAAERELKIKKQAY